MNTRVLIPEKKSFGVAYARKLNLLFMLTRSGADMYDVGSGKYINSFSTVNAPTDICFDEENKYIYLLDSLGDLYKYDMQKTIKGKEDALIKEQPMFELLNPCRQLHWIKEDIILGIGTTCDYLLDVDEEQKDKVYDVDDDARSKNNHRYYDQETGILTVVINGEKFDIEEREYIRNKFNIAIPIDVVTVKSDKFETTYVEDMQIMMEKKSSGLLKKNVPIMLKGDDLNLQCEIDKKLRKLLSQEYIYQTAVLDENILVLNTYKGLVLIFLDEKHPDFKVIDNVYGQFEKVDEHSLLFCVEKEGVVLLTV